MIYLTSGKPGITRGPFKSKINIVLLVKIKHLSDKTGIPQSKLADEAFQDLLVKYGDDPQQHIIKKIKEDYK